MSLKQSQRCPYSSSSLSTMSKMADVTQAHCRCDYVMQFPRPAVELNLKV